MSHHRWFARTDLGIPVSIVRDDPGRWRRDLRILPKQLCDRTDPASLSRPCSTSHDVSIGANAVESFTRIDPLGTGQPNLRGNCGITRAAVSPQHVRRNQYPYGRQQRQFRSRLSAGHGQRIEGRAETARERSAKEHFMFTRGTPGGPTDGLTKEEIASECVRCVEEFGAGATLIRAGGMGMCLYVGQHPYHGVRRVTVARQRPTTGIMMRSLLDSGCPVATDSVLESQRSDTSPGQAAPPRPSCRHTTGRRTASSVWPGGLSKLRRDLTRAPGPGAHDLDIHCRPSCLPSSPIGSAFRQHER